MARVTAINSRRPGATTCDCVAPALAHVIDNRHQICVHFENGGYHQGGDCRFVWDNPSLWEFGCAGRRE